MPFNRITQSSHYEIPKSQPNEVSIEYYLISGIWLLGFNSTLISLSFPPSLPPFFGLPTPDFGLPSLPSFHFSIIPTFLGLRYTE